MIANSDAKDDAFLLRPLVSGTRPLFRKVREDPDHPLRAEFDSFVLDFLEKTEELRGLPQEDVGIQA